VSRLATILWREAEARGRAEGQALGRAEGQALGRAEGAARGRAEAILGVLQARFGTVADDLSAIVCGQTDPARLEAWVGLAATCSGLAAFAAALPGS